MKLRAECAAPPSPGTRRARASSSLSSRHGVFGAQGTMLSSLDVRRHGPPVILRGWQMESSNSPAGMASSATLLYTLLLGVVGGMLIGGWFSCRATTGRRKQRRHGLLVYGTSLGVDPYADFERWRRGRGKRSSRPRVGTAAVAKTGGINPSTWGYVGASVATVAVTIVRQWFPGSGPPHRRGTRRHRRITRNADLLVVEPLGQLAAAWMAALPSSSSAEPPPNGISSSPSSSKRSRGDPGASVRICLNDYYYFFT